MQRDINFICPKCGSSYYGSSGPIDDFTRQCHGFKRIRHTSDKAERCTFSWHQSEDFKYFRLSFRADSAEEHLEMLNRFKSASPSR